MIKRTLQEIADFFDMALAMDKSGRWYLYEEEPKVCETSETWSRAAGYYVSRWMVDYSGDWRDSLTLPKSWTKEPPFREGEIVINVELGFPSVWRKEYDLNVDDYRRPTEAEWKVLRGEE